MHKSHFPICEQDAQDTQMTLSNTAIKFFHGVDAQESFPYM